MPTYDYSCPRCKAMYELREGFDAPTTQTCQECGKATAKRVLTAPRIVFKGSGWYATDSRSKTTAIADTPSEGGSDSKAEGNAETKSDGKPETKSESKPAKSESKGESKSSEPKSSSGESKSSGSKGSSGDSLASAAS